MLQMMEVEFLEVEVQEVLDEDHPDFKKQKLPQTEIDLYRKLVALPFNTSINKFPVVELDDGVTHLTEALSIAKHVSKGKYPGFYGDPQVD